jgi:hypothetical protein
LVTLTLRWLMLVTLTQVVNVGYNVLPIRTVTLLGRPIGTTITVPCF